MRKGTSLQSSFMYFVSLKSSWFDRNVWTKKKAQAVVYQTNNYFLNCLTDQETLGEFYSVSGSKCFKEVVCMPWGHAN